MNSKLALKTELETGLLAAAQSSRTFGRKNLNAAIKRELTARGWEAEPQVFDREGDPSAKMDFLKQRVGVEVGFTHQSFIGMDLLKFQVGSYSALDRIDVGVYITVTKAFQKTMKGRDEIWDGSISFEKVKKYLPHFKSAIQVPILVYGVDI